MSATLPDAALAAGRHNCWTCRHNQGFSNYCALMTGRFERHDVEAWSGKQEMSDGGADEQNMPPKTSDGCPGYEAKP